MDHRKVEKENRKENPKVKENQGTIGNGDPKDIIVPKEKEKEKGTTGKMTTIGTVVIPRTTGKERKAIQKESPNRQVHHRKVKEETHARPADQNGIRPQTVHRHDQVQDRWHHRGPHKSFRID